jgi:hypothetical protein
MEFIRFVGGTSFVERIARDPGQGNERIRLLWLILAL